jgi:hypothetical protein
MSRQIKRQKSTEGIMANYVERLIKLIPSEIIAVFLILQGLVPVEERQSGLIVIAGFLFVLIPFYLWYTMRVRSIPQIIISTISFPVWVYLIYGEVMFPATYESWVAAILMAVWVVVLPMFYSSRQDQ